MRDIIITLLVIIGWIYTLKRPYIGILVWSWLGYMNPHRLTYGFAYSMPFAYITALVLICSMMFSKETRKFPLNTLTAIWIFFILFMGITSLFAYFPEAATAYYLRIIKIQLVIFLGMMLITDMHKMINLIWVIVLSIGYFSIKGGLFTVLTGGSYTVWGPPESFIEDNNHFAIGGLMIIPLMVFLYQNTSKKWLRKALIVSIILSIFTVLGSQSRGALLAIATVGGFYWLKSKDKMISGLFIITISAVLFSFMPESWYKRMDTIQTYDEDASALGRLNAWEYAFNAANHNFLGMGLDSWSAETFYLYAPNPVDVHAAHSIYFSVLGDHGWIGLILFILIFFMAWRKLAWIIKQTDNDIESDSKSINRLARMLQVSLLAYLSGGAFLSLSYFDLPWHLVSFAVLLEYNLKQRVEQIKTPPKNASIYNTHGKYIE